MAINLFIYLFIYLFIHSFTYMETYIYIYKVSKKTTISQESMSTLHKNLTFICLYSNVLHPSRAYMLNELGPPRWAYLYIYIYIWSGVIKPSGKGGGSPYSRRLETVSG